MSRVIKSWVSGMAVVFVATVALAQPGAIFSVQFVNNEITYDATGAGSTTVGFWIEEDPSSQGYPNTVQGWSMSMNIDPTMLTVTGIDYGAYVATVNGGQPPAFWSVNTSVPGFTVGAVYDLFGNAVCVYDVAKEALLVDLATVPAAFAGNSVGASVPLLWAELGAPPVENIFVLAGGLSVDSSATNGTIDLVPSGVNFLRGDGDGNGSLSAITDAVAILNYQFNNGTLPCLDAADFNDDGAINLPDPIAILNWGFVMGPAPQAPFPLCGTDPSADALDCATPPTLCP